MGFNKPVPQILSTNTGWLQASSGWHVWCVVFALLVFNCNNAAAASEALKIRGTVLDAASRLPIPYATISVAGSDTHTLSNAKGEFSLTLKGGDEESAIRVSSVGYVTGSFPVADLLKKEGGAVRLELVPKQQSLDAVEVKARSKKWKQIKAGYHIGEGTTFNHELNPLDTVVAETDGQQLGNRILLPKSPVFLQQASFGLSGSGGTKIVVRLHIYSLKNNLPDQELLPEPVLIRVPPHHTGWITVNLQHYNITLTEDVAFVIEWLNGANLLNESSLMAFATRPKDQLTYYRHSPGTNWEILKSTLTNTRSNGMYVSLLYKK